MTSIFTPSVLLLALLGLAACSGYDITVNERVVYSPKPPFADYKISDNALSECVRQHIVDAAITAPSQLIALNCAHAGISNVDGLATFFELRQLKLSGNNIDNISALGSLMQLEDLYLDNNSLIDVGILYPFRKLATLDLSANPALICPRKDAFSHVASLQLPKHCQ